MTFQFTNKLTIEYAIRFYSLHRGPSVELEFYACKKIRGELSFSLKNIQYTSKLKYCLVRVPWDLEFIFVMRLKNEF